MVKGYTIVVVILTAGIMLGYLGRSVVFAAANAIVDPDPAKYTYYSGTSLASPHVYTLAAIRPVTSSMPSLPGTMVHTIGQPPIWRETCAHSEPSILKTGFLLQPLS